MKQLTDGPAHQRSVLAGFMLSLGRPRTRQQTLSTLRPVGALIPLDLSLIDLMEELDPGMVDWGDELRSLSI
ncbi:MAG: hypothetical protein ACRDWH_00225 [Acidimicrobiia bacterium]